MTKLEELATAMAVIMTDNGLPVSSPYDGNLDDVGHERWRVMVECARVVVSGLYEPSPKMIHAACEIMLPKHSSVQEWISFEKEYRIRYKAMINCVLMECKDDDILDGS